MKNIVIVGAGPIGLYLAIRLKQLGVKNVVVIDPRAGNYTRPGIINKKTFESLTKDIGYEVSYSSSRHIKDVERSLFKIAQDLGVDIRPYQFESFSGRGMSVTHVSTSSTFEIPCHLAFDATGSSRVLVNAVNSQFKEPLFQVKRIADNPVKNHFIAYVKMDSDNIAKLDEQYKTFKVSVLESMLALEKLRTQFGWQEFADPDFYFQILEKNKVCFYYEIPEALNKAQHEAWLTSLLELKFGKSDIFFEKITSNKPLFNPYTVDPHRVKTLMFMGKGETPIVIPIGDAQVEPDYRTAYGIYGGTDRVKGLLESLSIKDGDIIQIDQAIYQDNMDDWVEKYKSKLRQKYFARNKVLTDALALRKRDYKAALLMAGDNESLVSSVQSALRAIAEKYLQLFDQAEEIERQDFLKKGLKIYFSKTVYDKEILLELIRKNDHPSNDEEKQKEFLVALFGMAAKREKYDLFSEACSHLKIKFDVDDIIGIIETALPHPIPFEILHQLIKNTMSSSEEKEVREVDEKRIFDFAIVIAFSTENFQELTPLLAHGASLDQIDTRGNSLLYKTIQNERFHLVEKLLELNVNPNQSNHHGETPLMLAAQMDNIETVQLLLTHGADPTIQDDLGRSVLSYANEGSEVYQMLDEAIQKWPLLDRNAFQSYLLIRFGQFAAPREGDQLEKGVETLTQSVQSPNNKKTPL